MPLASPPGPTPGLTAALTAILALALLAGILTVLYYRRRLAVLRTDLANRSGRDNGGLAGGGILEPSRLTPQPGLRVQQLPAQHNNSISFSRFTNDAAHNPLYIVNYRKPDKNINENVYQEPQDVKLDNLSQVEQNYDIIPPPRPLNNANESTA